LANYLWPDEFRPNTFALERYSKAVRSRSVFGGSGQTVHLMNDRWTASMTISLMDVYRASKLEAFCNRLRRSVNTVELYHYARPAPMGTAQGAGTLTSAAVQGASSFSASIGIGETLLVGDLVGIDGLLFTVSEDTAADGSGAVTITTAEPTRRAISNGALVVLSEPKTKFRLIAGSVPIFDYGPNSVVEGVTLEFVEAIPS
jgi:hypothetical protein